MDRSKLENSIAGRLIFMLLCTTICLSRAAAQEAKPTTPSSRPTSRTTDLERAKALAVDFIRWFELQYINNMQKVDGRDTDVADLLKEMSKEKVIDRYTSLRREDMDLALKYPKAGSVPKHALDAMLRRKLQKVLGSIRSSKEWIDYDEKDLKSGIIEAYRIESRVWLPFYRKLVLSPLPADVQDFRALIRHHYSREQYAKLIEQTLAGARRFYSSLKEGVAWYAPWGPWVRGSIDEALKKDIEIWRKTADRIYNEKK